MRPIIRDRLVDRVSAVHFFRIAAGLYTVTPLLLGTIQLMGGYQNPGYWSAFGNEPFAFAGWLVVIGLSLFVITWFWLGKAADVVSAFRYKKPWIPANSFVIKIVVTSLAVLNIFLATFYEVG